MKKNIDIFKFKFTAILGDWLKLAFLLITLVPVYLMIILKPKRKLPGLLVYGLGEEQIFTGKNRTDLAEFFTEKRFDLNLAEDEILVELSKKRINQQISNVIITPNISIYILIFHFKRNISLELLKSMRKKISLKSISVRSIKKYSVSLKKLIETAVWEYISNSHLETQIVLTNSLIHSMPTPIAINRGRISTFLFWYSTNDQIFRKKGEEKKDLQKLDYLNEFITINFAWNDSHKSNLVERGLKNVKVSGSIIFRTKSGIGNQNINKRVLYFDVTPQDIPGSFYTTDMSLVNLKDLVDCVGDISSNELGKVALLIKQKRKYTKIHSKTYLKVLNKLSDSGAISILDPYTNIYDEILQSQAVVVMPFSSPALIASELKIPVVYYCGRKTDWDLGEENFGVKVLTKKSDLEEFLTDLFQ